MFGAVVVALTFRVAETRLPSRGPRNRKSYTENPLFARHVYGSESVTIRLSVARQLSPTRKQKVIKHPSKISFAQSAG
jgi:hypothetical protein